MSCINEAAFGRPGVFETASGMGNPGLIGQPARDRKIVGGIKDPKPVVIPSDTLLVRFGSKQLIFDSGKGPTLSGKGLMGLTANGAWWLEAKEFAKIEAYAHASGVSVAVALRLLCFVPNEWSTLDTRFRATTVAQLKAYQGVGNPVFLDEAGPRSASSQPAKSVAAPTVNQLYIPGLNDQMVDAALAMRTFDFSSPNDSRLHHHKTRR